MKRTDFIKGFAVVLAGVYILLGASEILASGENWLTGWDYRKKITIDYTKVDGTLTDFPVLVKLTSSNFDFSKALSSGNDIRFTSSDGSTLLKYERERHDSANSAAEYWVKIPSVSSSAATEFYIYYGNSGAADGQDAANVWDANFKMIQHLQEGYSAAADYYKDSTSNSNNGQLTDSDGDSSSAAGKADGAIDFNGDADYISTPFIDLRGSFTVEAWVYCDTDTWLPFIVQSEGGTNKHFHFTRRTGGKIRLGFYYNDLDVDTSELPTGGWYHVVAYYDTSNNSRKIYVNGVEKASDTASSDYLGSIGNTWIGYNSNGSNYMNGKIDEVHISNTVRSAAWIKASYNSGNDSLASYGSEEIYNSAPSAPTIALLFDNEKAVAVPAFKFTGTDPDSDDLDYQIRWDTDINFGLPTTKSSSDYPTDAGWTAATFTSGTQVTYTVQSALTNAVTYWWQACTRDPSGTNTWSGWTTARSFTIDTSITAPTWFQTTKEQFDTDTATGSVAPQAGTNDVRMSGP